MSSMRIIKAEKVAAAGMSIGRVSKYSKRQISASKQRITPDGVESELERYRAAVAAAVDQVTALSARSDVFAAHAELLQDYALAELVKENITDKLENAELAVEHAIAAFSDMLESMDDAYMQERAADVKDIGERLLSVLQGVSRQAFQGSSDEKVVVIADDLTPSDTVTMDKDQICGFVTQKGGLTSHVAIIAKSMGIPSFVGVQGVMDIAADGETIILNTEDREIILEPGETVKEEFISKKLDWEEKQRRLLDIGKKSACTTDGKHVKVFANVGCLEDVRRAAEYGADGIGLFRTEFLYMEGKHFPTEEEQFAVYKEAAIAFEKEITIRTLDIGGDKGLPYFEFEHEENPFLGWRAIRISLSMKELFKAQLRALLRTSPFGNIRVMYPMIISLEELEQANAVMRECKAELQAEGKPFDSALKVGMMIETPAAVMLAEEFAQLVDFFSIGTNDLTQYMLAVDRGNQKIAELYNPFHPAVIRSIEKIIKAGHAAGIEVGMCGEFAADQSAVGILIGMGIDELSVAFPKVPDIKQTILGLCAAQSKAAAEKIQTCRQLCDVYGVCCEAGASS